eukprot:GFKZ01000821.1.p1 GENE.GFKZ01000821.1~~GFKZ01000821.1.p1  ORF type:complete len:502 (+),score=103.36 GFKZ01000821.1:49-1506(+)
MSPTPSRKKRQRQPGYNRKHDRHKFRRTTNPTVHKKSLPSQLRGILFSCTPRHEDRAFRDAVLLLSKHHQHLHPSHASHRTVEASPPPDTDVNAALQQELSEIRGGGGGSGGRLFTRVDGGVQGCVFVVVNHDAVDLERLVELALREARECGFAPSRHCMRMLPIHVTCYAKPAEAAEAAVGVVGNHFPKLGEGEGEVCTYAIVFRARLNDGAHREEYIQAVAAAVEKTDPRYKVNLKAPQVVLIVEIVKTTCCLGAFRYFYELAKMNLMEAACPTKVKDGNAKEDGGKAKESSGKAEDGDGIAKKHDGKGEAEEHDGKGEAKEGCADGDKTTEEDGGSDKDAEEKDGTEANNAELGRDDAHDSNHSTVEGAVANPKKDGKDLDRGEGEANGASYKSAAERSGENVSNGDVLKGELEPVCKETPAAKSVAGKDAEKADEGKPLAADSKESEDQQAKQDCEQPAPAEDDCGRGTGDGGKTGKSDAE